jgi:hypothetical protein
MPLTANLGEKRPFGLFWANSAPERHFDVKNIFPDFAVHICNWGRILLFLPLCTTF